MTSLGSEGVVGPGFPVPVPTLPGATSSPFRVAGVKVNNGANPILVGYLDEIPLPWSGTITEWEIEADQPGSVVFNVLVDTYVDFPPTLGNSIVGLNKPFLAGTIKNKSTNLTGWSPHLNARDIIGFYAESASTITRATLTLYVTLD